MHAEVHPNPLPNCFPYLRGIDRGNPMRPSPWPWYCLLSEWMPLPAGAVRSIQPVADSGRSCSPFVEWRGWGQERIVPAKVGESPKVTLVRYRRRWGMQGAAPGSAGQSPSHREQMLKVD
jgi:hypothetical protein